MKTILSDPRIQMALGAADLVVARRRKQNRDQVLLWLARVGQHRAGLSRRRREVANLGMSSSRGFDPIQST